MSETILLADDSPIVIRLLKQILEPEGYDLVAAADGQEAIDLFREQQPDMLLLDVMMPRKTGYEVCEELETELENTPVFFLSARDDVQARITGLELGAVDFVSKPFQKKEILAKIRNQLKIQRLTRSLIAANDELHRRQNQLEEDLEAAAGIQQSLVLRESPGIPGVRTAWQFMPCDEVGGDIFGALHLDETHWGFFMVDVSGHGVPSAMVTVSVSQTLSPSGDVVKTRTSEPPYYRITPPVEVLERLDTEYPIDRFDKYFTICYLVYDVESRELRYSSAAHPPPVVLRSSGSIEHLREGGSIIGLGAIVPFEEGHVQLEQGDRLFLYTDGLVEILRDNAECYGEERLADSISSTADVGLDEGCKSIIQKAMTFGGNEKPQDDISVLAIEIESLESLRSEASL